MKKLCIILLSLCLVGVAFVGIRYVSPLINAQDTGRETSCHSNRGNRMDDNNWRNNVDASVNCPQTIRLGEQLNIEITTANNSCRNLRYGTSGTSLGKGIKINKICLSSDNSVEIYNRYAFETMDYRIDCFRDGEVRCDTYCYDLKIWTQTGEGEFDYGLKDPPKGCYDIHLSNGTIIYNAFEII